MAQETNRWHFIDHEDLPSWGDSGRAELLRNDGMIIDGLLTIDAWYAGDDEIPTASFVTDDGRHLSIYDFQAWRHTTTKHPITSPS